MTDPEEAGGETQGAPRSPTSSAHHPRPRQFDVSVHPLGGHCLAIRGKPAPKHGKKQSKVVPTRLRESYLRSERPECPVRSHPAVAGADLGAGEHGAGERGVACGGRGTWPWGESLRAHLKAAQEGVELLVGHVLIELACKTGRAGVWGRGRWPCPPRRGLTDAPRDPP